MTSNDELEKLRYLLNNMIISDSNSTEEVLKLSQELDVLVVQWMREKTYSPGSLLVEDKIMRELENKQQGGLFGI